MAIEDDDTPEVGEFGDAEDDYKGTDWDEVADAYADYYDESAEIEQPEEEAEDIEREAIEAEGLDEEGEDYEGEGEDFGEGEGDFENDYEGYDWDEVYDEYEDYADPLEYFSNLS